MPPVARVGIIGAGYIARLHAERLVRQPDVQIVGIADPSLDRASELAHQVGSSAYGEVDDFLRSHHPDALFICVPPFAHGEPEWAALERDIPFFVEKPISIDKAMAESIGAEVRARGLVTAVGYHWRHADVVQEAASLLREREVRLVQGYWLSSTPGAAWWRRRDMSGGQILEQTTHIFDLIRTLVGEAAVVEGNRLQHPRPDLPDSDVADVSVVTLRFASGAIGVVSSTCLLYAARRVGVHLISDGLSLELSAKGPGGGPPFEMIVTGKGESETHIGRNDPFLTEQREFLEAVRGERAATLVPYEEALLTHRLALAARQSCEEAVPIELAHPSARG